MRCSPKAGPRHARRPRAAASHGARPDIPFGGSGRVVIVTGGNSGIGLGIARGAARAGASVAVWSRREERNSEAVAELAGLGGLEEHVTGLQNRGWLASTW